MKVDILAIGAHPDDVELAVSGTIASHVAKGKKVAIVDLTRGELGTRGSAELRHEEAAAAAKLLGVSQRVNLDLGDGFFEINEQSLLRIVEQIRFFQPEIVLANALRDRHPDHGRGGDIVSRAAFLAGLTKIETSWEGQPQKAYRPKAVYRYIQDNFIEPDFVVDITGFEDIKIKAIMCFSSQFYNPASTEPVTPISTPEFMDNVKARMVQMGRYINATHGEGFTVERPLGISDLSMMR